MLPLVADLVVRNTKIRTEDVLKEGPESDIKVVGHDVGVVLDIRPDDPLPGPIVTRKIVRKPWEVPLEVVPLHIRTAQGEEHGCRGRGQEARVGQETAKTVPLIRTGAREYGPLTDDLRQEGCVRI